MIINNINTLIILFALSLLQKRPEYASPLGCTPGRTFNDECPTRMECMKDANYERGGRCDCNPLWFKYAGKLPFDGAEFDDGFSTSDCLNHHPSRFFASMFYLAMVFSLVGFIYTDVTIIKELIRVKALKLNATATSLFVLLWASTSLFFCVMIYLMNTWDADKTEYWYSSRTPLFVYALIPVNVITDFEIGVTWIDLYDRTNKMSKSTSKTIKVLRWFLRIIAFTMSFGFLIWTLTGNALNLLISAFMPSVIGMVFVSIGGKLITKTLCSSKKDTANPNWRVAEAIRRAVKHAVGAKFLEIFALCGQVFTMRNASLGYVYPWFVVLYCFANSFRMWGWLNYLIHGSRKHLQRYTNDGNSAYFGFSTIGLNKSIVSTASNFVSTRSSVAPSQYEAD